MFILVMLYFSLMHENEETWFLNLKFNIRCLLHLLHSRYLIYEISLLFQILFLMVSFLEIGSWLLDLEIKIIMSQIHLSIRFIEIYCDYDNLIFFIYFGKFVWFLISISNLAIKRGLEYNKLLPVVLRDSSIEMKDFLNFV